MPKPVLPSHDSASYELLSLTALCGEFPCDSAARLISSESYRKKIVTGLTHNRLLRIFSRNHLRGYRLGIRGKRLLQDQEPERFLFYLSGCGDTNAIKSEPSRRLRLHRIARTLRVSDYTPQYRESNGIGKRPLLTPDEVLRLPVDEALVILRGHKVLKVHKMDYSLHPAYKHLRECKASAHIPEWQTAVPETPSAITPSTAPIAKTPPKRRGRKAKTVVAADKTSIMTKPENEKELSHGNEQ